MNKYRLEILYVSGRTETSGAPDQRGAEKLRNKYLALPSVQSVIITPIKERRQ